MPLKNYTTEISASKSVGEIQGILVAHGATAIMVNYGPDHEPSTVSFIVRVPQGDIPFRLPVHVAAVAKILSSSRDPNYRRYDAEYQKALVAKIRAQASRVAWRILKDWVDAQMAIIETEMVTIEQVFLPYMQVKDGKTLYEVMVDQRFLLSEGSDESR